jgi:hypothetical protein
MCCAAAEVAGTSSPAAPTVDAARSATPPARTAQSVAHGRAAETIADKRRAANRRRCSGSVGTLRTPVGCARASSASLVHRRAARSISIRRGSSRREAVQTRNGCPTSAVRRSPSKTLRRACPERSHSSRHKCRDTREWCRRSAGSTPTARTASPAVPRPTYGAGPGG